MLQKFMILLLTSGSLALPLERHGAPFAKEIDAQEHPAASRLVARQLSWGYTSPLGQSIGQTYTPTGVTGVASGMLGSVSGSAGLTGTSSQVSNAFGTFSSGVGAPAAAPGLVPGLGAGIKPAAAAGY